MSFQFNKDQYDKSVREGNFVSEMRKYGLDVATTNIHNSSNQNQIWDDTGMTFRQWNERKQNYDPEQIKIINNLIAISDDGFNKSTVAAIGKIPIDKNGNFAWGVNAQVLVSKLVMSQNLWIENDSGTYKFTDDGFNASNGKNTIKIQPNKSEELFSIYKDSRKQVYINSNGDVEFAGSLKSASGTFSGLISGGSINLGNGTFTVDQNGNMYASSGVFGGDCTFKGTLDGADGSFSGTLDGVDGNFTGTLYGNDIIGATITGANGEFTEGFEVNLPSTLIGGVADGNYMISFNSDGLFLGMKYYDGTQKGITISDNLINIDCSDGKYGDCVYINDEIPATKNDIPVTGFSGDGKEGVYNSIHMDGTVIKGSKISYNDLKSKLSDERLKRDIYSITLPAIEDFYMNLIPTRHKYKNGVGVGEDGKYQFGVIAQWTEKDMIDHAIDPNSYSIVRKSKPFSDTAEAQYTDGDDVYRVDYDQFHALHIYMIQKQQKEIESLQRQIKELERKIS